LPSGCFYEVKGYSARRLKRWGGDVAFERARGFALGLPFADAAIEVGARLGLVLGAKHRDRVDRVVDLAVAAAVETVSHGITRGGW
jgi:hypothetical protein